MKGFWGILLILLLGAESGWAALGEPEASVKADGQVIQGQIREEAHEGYRLHQITDARGGVVREYISPAGKVFGVAWQGRFVPNLRQLLGAYFSDVQAYAQAQTRRHGGPLVIQKDNWVFISGGHMGGYQGRAYVINLLPTHLSPEVVQ